MKYICKLGQFKQFYKPRRDECIVIIENCYFCLTFEKKPHFIVIVSSAELSLRLKIFKRFLI
jgi:hypothetical protein